MDNLSDTQPGAPSRYPDPPPFRPLFLTGGPGGPIPRGLPKSRRKDFWVPVRAALEWYLDSIKMFGKPFEGWEQFECDLAQQFALLLLLLAAAGREDSRRRMLEWFLQGLNLENRVGRARKAKDRLADISHGRYMDNLWNENQGIQQAWNMKVSLENQGKDAFYIRSRMRRSQIAEAIINAVLSPRATPDSSLARVYAWTKNISVGRARNALRAYKKYSDRKFGPQP